MTKKTPILPLFRPPVIVVLGHVDHGKTSLLDRIRKTHVTEKEHGGITQHIGAYQISVKHSAFAKATEGKQASIVKQESSTDANSRSRGISSGGEEKLITFIDTPGHEAFSKMRSRGAAVADIAILVVAADDGVMPQTKESIEQIKAAGIPVIVALNKIDLPSAQPDRVKGELAKAGIQVEGFGGEVPIVQISAKEGTGIDELLELISIVWELQRQPIEQFASAEAVVIETRIDKGKGMVATVLVKKGELSRTNLLYEDANEVAKIRGLIDEYGKQIGCVGPSIPVEVLGFRTLPGIGSILSTQPRLIQTPPSPSPSRMSINADIPDFLKSQEDQKQKELIIILKADTAGSLEAITGSLDGRIRVVGSGIADITDADILHAKSSGAIVIGFGVKIAQTVAKLAETEKVIYRIYTIIYTLLEELGEVADGLKEVLAHERDLGKGVIIAEFPYEHTRIAGIRITEGRIARGDTIRLMRGETETGKAKVKSIRQGKNETTRINAGNECGILFDQKLDFMLNDGIIAYTTG